MLGRVYRSDPTQSERRIHQNRRMVQVMRILRRCGQVGQLAIQSRRQRPGEIHAGCEPPLRARISRSLVRPVLRPASRNAGQRYSRLKKRRPDRRVLRPADRPVKRQFAGQCALHVDHVFSVHHPERAREILLHQRQPRIQRDRAGLPVLSRLPNLKRLHLRLAVPRQSGGAFFLRGSAEAIHTHEVPHRSRARPARLP